MGIYRVFAGSDGESHMEELRLEEHPALGALTNIHEVRVQQFDGTRKMDFHPLPERRLIIHLSGEVEIGTSDGSRHVFRAGDIRLMEGVSHVLDLSEDSSKLIPIHAEPNHQIVHLFRLGKAHCPTYSPLDAGP
jgi:hypothetical protein